MSVSAELVRWESPLECVCVTAEGVTISWGSGTVRVCMLVCVCVYVCVATWVGSFGLSQCF